MRLTGNAMTIELTLPDMTCGHCVKTVTATAQRLDPEARVQTDLATHRVTIDSATVGQAAFEAALAEEGYPAARSAGNTRT
jgi:copper chaperone